MNITYWLTRFNKRLSPTSLRKPMLVVFFFTTILGIQSQTVVHTQDFEAGTIAPWTDGGADCFFYNGGFSPQGAFSVYMRSNTASARTTSPTLDLSPYTTVTFSFDFRALNWDDAADFFELQYSNNNGTTWTTVKTYTGGTEITANNFVYSDALSLSNATYSFTALSRFRIRNRTTQTNDFTFVDNFRIEGYAPGAYINVLGNGISIADGDTTPAVNDNTDFGETNPGVPVQRSFTIQNGGNQNLTLSGASPYVTLSGTNAADFTVTTPPAQTIAANGGTTSFTVTFNPSGFGASNATLTINSNAVDEPVYNFDLRGTSRPLPRDQYTVIYESFDENDGGWTSTNPGGNTAWAHGTNGFTDETGEGNYWYTNNYNDYNANSDTYVTSPIYDLSNYSDLVLKADVRTSIANYNYDGTNWNLINNDLDDGWNMEYSINGGAWTVLGSVNQGDNWYNTTAIGSLGGDGWSDQNNEGSTDAADGKSKFEQASLFLPAAFDNASNVRFRLHFASDADADVYNGVNFDNFMVIGVPITPLAAPSVGPGNSTSDLRLWLKADASTYVDGDAVTSLPDNAFDNNAEMNGTTSPTLRDNLTDNFNFNPVIEFDDATSQELQGKGGFFSTDYFAVVRPNTPATSGVPQETIISGRATPDAFAEDGTGLYFNSGSLRFQAVNNLVSAMIGSTPGSLNGTTDLNYGRAYEDNTDTLDEIMILNVKQNAGATDSEIYLNGKQIDNYTGLTSTSSETLPYSEVGNSTYLLGVGRITKTGTPFDSHFDGRMSEIISFSSVNSATNQQKIYSYLSLKYGITLHSPTSTTVTELNDFNYLDSNGTIIWDTAANNGYNYDVAGIGRDDQSGLNQKQSRSVNTDSQITIGLTDIYDTNRQNISSNPNTFNDRNFLMWGNDNDPMVAVPSINVDMSANIAGLSSPVDFLAVDRTWKVVETGSVGMTKVTIDESELTATITPPGNFLMFISDSPVFDPSSEYRVMTEVGGVLETEYNFNGTKYITFGYAPEYYYERSITFGGTQDYMEIGDELDLISDFTVSSWVKKNANDGTILSKRDASYTQGYDLKILSNGRVQMTWKNGSTQTITSNTVIPQGIWHHIAVIYDNGANSASIYIDGVLDTTASMTPMVDTDQYFIIGAAGVTGTTDFFDGTLDEVRVWNRALSIDQLRYIMNQEIETHTDATVRGKIIPQNISKNEVAAIPWGNLSAYFPMNRYTFTNVKDESDNNLIAAIKNLETVDFQSAPLPYQTDADGDWDTPGTWEYSGGLYLPNGNSIVDGSVIDWNIIHIDHNVTNQTNKTVLGLNISGGNELSVQNSTMMKVTHYLKLDGLMDLEGASQLVQTAESDLDLTSTGSLEKDQDGTADTFTYNYWSPPVSMINGSDINVDFDIASLLFDGTNPANPQPIVYTGGFDGAATSPITLSSYWFYKFDNFPSQSYADWQYVGPTGVMRAGEGYTMKGPGTGGVTDPQNYTFIGKPNNSTTAKKIELEVFGGNSYLVGNPFPSALDARDFIMDNPHLDGTLYFWDHWGGGSHYYQEYQAGYAMYNMSGGVPATAYPGTDTTGGTPSGKVPSRYVAVGQGFFVDADSNGFIQFDNAHRNFQPETATDIFFFGEDNSEDSADSFTGGQTNNTSQNEPIGDSQYDPIDDRMKARIGFTAATGNYRQLLLTIDKEHTTFDYDKRYDGLRYDEQQDDMAWKINEDRAVIQGAPSHEDHDFPLEVRIGNAGVIKISLDDLAYGQSVEDNVYLIDYTENIEYNLTVAPYEAELAVGDYSDRYAIRFRQSESDEEGNEEDDETLAVETSSQATTAISISYMKSENGIKLINPNNLTLNRAVLYSMLGQKIQEWPQTITSTTTLPVSTVSTGTYILQLFQEGEVIIKKLIIH